MKTIKLWALLSIVALCNHLAFAQTKSIEFNIKFDTAKVAHYQLKPYAKNQTYLQTHYAGYYLINPENARKLTSKTVTQVDLIYTQHPKKANLELLTKKRLATLYLVAPQLFDNPYIQWNMIIQTDYNDKNVFNLFHGFVIKYRPGTASYAYKGESDRLKSFVSGKTVLRDSTVLKIMERNLKWSNMAIVGDFTGSMTPYIAQVLLWHKLNLDVNQKKIKRFVFFNDGDQKLDMDKKIGTTGGIYHTQKLKLDSVVNTAIATIKGGFGGDGPENDVEALLFAQKQNPKVKHLVLIADNWSTMRDIKLMKKIKKPVRVVLCGVQNAVNVEYLNLAYRTKGSVHTIEEDIYNLIKIKEGGTIMINGHKYRLKKGQFYKI
ncbi:hypothetical protein BKI52_09850 [marine bacterium AO1-C]|nr:hypothetical protein BKI52_09850 [marine bacterium AO1-C]